MTFSAFSSQPSSQRYPSYDDSGAWPAYDPYGQPHPQRHQQGPPPRDDEWWTGGGPPQPGYADPPPWPSPPPPPVQPQAPEVPYTGPTDHELFLADIRRQVGTRLQAINSKHCHEAFDRLDKRNAIGPHGMVLFYAVVDETQRHGYRLQIATRFFLAGPESDDLPQILDDLQRTAAGNIARARSRGRRWDPRGPEDSMVNGGDMSMPRDAEYVGVGVSTLDMEDSGWYSAAQAVRNQSPTASQPRTVFDLPGRGIAMLTDGSAVRAIRDPRRRSGEDGIACNKNLDPRRVRYWNFDLDLTEQGDPTFRAAWRGLEALNHMLQTYLVEELTS